MAVPVRLTVGNVLNRRILHLDAVNFNLAVERNISVFAAPFNNAFKVGIDPNMAVTSINVQGVLVDDSSQSIPSTPASLDINMRPFYSNSTHRLFSSLVGVMQDILLLHPQVKSVASVATGSTSPISVSLPSNAKVGSIFDVGDKVYLDDGKELGTITALSNTSKTITIGAGTSVPLMRKQRIVTTNPDNFLHGKGFALMPHHWIDNPPDPSRPDLPIVYRFDGNNSPTYSGGSATPQIVSNSQPERGANAVPTITIPIKGIYTSSTNGKPATSLASIIKDAIETTGAITHGAVTGSGGNSSNDAFAVTFRDADQTILSITQKEGGGMEGTINPFQPLGFPSSNSGQGILPWQYNRIVGYLFFTSPLNTTNLTPNTPVSRPFSGGSDAQNSRSAGDKAQDLLGVFANSPVSSDDDIVGIQIPYDTLITSSSVSTEVRNFFLTFGRQIPKEMKGSDNNTRPASAPMDLMGRQVREQNDLIGPELKEVPVIGPIVDTLGDILDTALNLGSDIFIEIGGTSFSGNRGGMLIIPSGLNIHQEAGQPFYTFDMRLHAAQHKIAP